jgi:hypothetical protein
MLSIRFPGECDGARRDIDSPLVGRFHEAIVWARGERIVVPGLVPGCDDGDAAVVANRKLSYVLEATLARDTRTNWASIASRCSSESDAKASVSSLPA